MNKNITFGIRSYFVNSKLFHCISKPCFGNVTNWRPIRRVNVASDEVLGHLDRVLAEAAFLVERSIIVAAIKDRLVTPDRASVIREESDHSLPQLHPPSAGVDHNVFDVRGFPAAPDELRLDEHTPRRHDLPRPNIFHDANDMVVSQVADLSKPVFEILFGDRFANR